MQRNNNGIRTPMPHYAAAAHGTWTPPGLRHTWDEYGRVIYVHVDGCGHQLQPAPALPAPMFPRERVHRHPRPLASALRRSAGADCTAVMSTRRTRLVLRDGLWREHGGWQIVDMSGNAWFRYRGAADSPTGRPELWRADGRGIYVAETTVMSLHSRVFVNRAEGTRENMFTLRKSGWTKGYEFKCFRGSQDTVDFYVKVRGSVREGSLVICKEDGDESVPIARVLRPEINPSVGVREGEFVLKVQPLFNVALACMLTLLVDNIQRL